MNLQEQLELQSEENARWDYIAVLKEEMRDHFDVPEPLDMDAWRTSVGRQVQANKIEPIYDDNGEEICY